MGEQLIRPYQISIWEDRLVESDGESYYEEVKIAEIGSDTMTSQNRVYSPVFKINTNGEKTLTFSLRYKYYDETVGDFVVNPFEKFLVNERKVKLFYKDEWHDFVIKEKEEESEEYTFSYTCTDLFVQELSKNGYGITFNTDLGNNQGTIIELAEKTLEDTDWVVDRVNSDLLRQKIVEPIYECKVNGSFEALDTETNETVTIENDEIIYVFYSYIANKEVVDVQFLRAADREKWSYDNNNAIIGTNYRFPENISYDNLNEPMVINYGSAAINIGLINTESQGYRLVYNNLSTYDPVMGRTVNIYRYNYDDGYTQDIYNYTDTHYGTSAILQNYVTNGSNFTTYNGTGITGWSEAVDTNTDRYLSLGITTYPELTGAAALAQISELKQIKGFLELETPANDPDSKEKYQYPFFNSGIVDNAAFVGGIRGGDKFLLRVRYQWAPTKHGTLNNPQTSNVRAVVAGYTLESKTLADGSKVSVKKINDKKIYIDFDGDFQNGNDIKNTGKFNSNHSNYLIDGVIQTPSDKYVYKEADDDTEYVWSIKDNSFKPKTDENFTNYYYTTATATQSISQAKLADPTNRIGLFIYQTNDSDQYTYIEDIEITKYYEDANGNPIFVGSAPEAKTEVINNFYLKPEDGATSETVELYSSLESLAKNLNIDVDKIELVKNEQYEKILSIEASKSNCFNILQDLCETFECWLKINVAHDSIGRIKLDKYHKPIKKVCFKEYVGKDNFAGFKYGINLNSINRSIDSNEFVTKLIVGQPASDYTTSGTLNIGEARSNPSGESYILNFNYYLNQGLIKDKAAFNEDLNNFNKALKEKNILIQNLTDKYILASAALEHAKANRNIYAESAEAASEKYAKALSDFETIVGQSYNDFMATNPDVEQLEKNTALRKAIDDIYAAAVQVNNYQGLLTNINKEYNDLNIECNGVPSYGVTVTTFKSTTEGLPDSTRLVLSDYIEGFKCIFSGPDELSSSWESEVNDKDFSEDILYDKIIITAIPTNYELEYSINGQSFTKALEGRMVFDITSEGEGWTRGFRLVPTQDYEKEFIGLKQQIDIALEEKSKIEKEFYTKYSRFIQEGTWESTDYIDNELYYMDALQVSNASAQPKVSYTINVMEIGELEGYENYNFNVGDRTYIEDTDFFGWEYFEENGVDASTPVKETVVVTEVEWHLDEPETNVITVQNYKTQFEDLFQRISATVQSVEYNQASYARAASILDANGHINPSLLVGSLNAIAGNSFNLAANGVLKVTDEGIIVRNLTNPGNLLIIKSRGIESSQDGGMTWQNLVSPQGINTEKLTSGSIDTQNITIMDGESPSFRWDANGISAYGFTESASGRRLRSTTDTKKIDLNTYVRYDKYGLYGVQNGEDYVATSLDDIKEKASFGLTWDGFFIKNKYRDGYVSISSTDDFQVVANGTERIKIGKFNDNNKYGIRIKNDEGATVFETDDNGDISMAGTIRAAGGEIGGFIITDNALSSGIIGDANSVLVSPGYRTSIPIAGSTGARNWAFVASHNFGVDTEGHLYATAANIRGNIYAENGYFSGHIDATSGTFMNELRVGGGEKYIVLQGYADRTDSLIASSDYINNPSAGWAISGYGDAIFNNVSVRGAIKTAVFEYNEIEAVGGAFLFRPSTTIKGARIRNNDIVLTLEKPNLFQVDEWVKLSNINSESSAGAILNDGGLTHVYKIINQNGKEVTLEGAAKDFVTSESIESYDEWGSIGYGYKPTSLIGEETNPRDAELYEFVNEEYILTQDTTIDSEKTYYQQYYPSYSTITFGDPLNFIELTIYDETSGKYRPLQLNAPRYEVYFNDHSYIKNLNFDLRNTSSGSVEVTFNQIQTSYTNDITGETWEYTIEKYIGNLSLFSAELKNTGESFLIAQIQEVYKETSTSEGVETSYTRIYSNLLYEVPFILSAQEAQDTVDSLEGGSLISFGYHSSSSSYEDGIHNYGIGINSSDNYVNLPQRAISLFESEIHPDPNETIKVTYNFRGILGTLPPINSFGLGSIYSNYLQGTQGIYTDNMYIGDASRYLTFYTVPEHYELTQDTQVDNDKTYYSKNNNVYTEVEPQGNENPHIEGWYEDIPSAKNLRINGADIIFTYEIDGQTTTGDINDVINDIEVDGGEGLVLTITSNHSPSYDSSNISATLTAHLYQNGTEVTPYNAIQALNYQINWYINGTLDSLSGKNTNVYSVTAIDSVTVTAKLEDISE